MCSRPAACGGELWHVDGIKRLQRNALLRARDTYDYTFTEWIFGRTALTLDEEPELYPVIPLDSVAIGAEDVRVERQPVMAI